MALQRNSCQKYELVEPLNSRRASSQSITARFPRVDESHSFYLFLYCMCHRIPHAILFAKYVCKNKKIHILHVNIQDFVLFLFIIIELFLNSVFQLYFSKDYYKQKQRNTLPVIIITEIINFNRLLWWLPWHYRQVFAFGDLEY